jgi:hypothetical protein
MTNLNPLLSYRPIEPAISKTNNSKTDTNPRTAPDRLDQLQVSPEEVAILRAYLSSEIDGILWPSP